MKSLNLRAEIETYKNNSDLKKIVDSNPLPLKYTIDEIDCYFYNPTLYGLFELRVTKDGITPNDFINDYKDGFIKGLAFLKDDAEIEIKDIKNINLKAGTIAQLRNILYEQEFLNPIKGLLKVVFELHPNIFTKQGIYNFGYWNGIIHSIENLCKITGLNSNDLQDIRQSKKIFDFIHNVNDKKEFLSDLAENFKMEKGKSIKAVINILKDAELIIIPDRQFQTFFDLLKSQFKTDIGSYTSVNDAEKNKGFADTLKKFQVLVKPLIIKYKIK